MLRLISIVALNLLIVPATLTPGYALDFKRAIGDLAEELDLEDGLRSMNALRRMLPQRQHDDDDEDIDPRMLRAAPQPAKPAAAARAPAAMAPAKEIASDRSLDLAPQPTPARAKAPKVDCTRFIPAAGTTISIDCAE